jgi:hypothetical protein
MQAPDIILMVAIVAISLCLIAAVGVLCLILRSLASKLSDISRNLLGAALVTDDTQRSQVGSWLLSNLNRQQRQRPAVPHKPPPTRATEFTEINDPGAAV